MNQTIPLIPSARRQAAEHSASIERAFLKSIPWSHYFLVKNVSKSDDRHLLSGEVVPGTTLSSMWKTVFKWRTHEPMFFWKPEPDTPVGGYWDLPKHQDPGVDVWDAIECWRTWYLLKEIPRQDVETLFYSLLSTRPPVGWIVREYRDGVEL